MQNPTVISGATRTCHNWCQKWYGSFELLDLRQVSASFHKNGHQQIVEMPSQMEANKKADQAKAEASMKTHMQEMMERQIGSLATEMRSGQDKMDANQARMEDRLREEIKSNQANAEANMKIHRQEIVIKIDANQDKMEAIGRSIWSERDGEIQCRSENVMERQEIPKARLECKEPASKDMESRAELHRGRHMAAGRSAKRKKPTRGDCGSRGRLVTACRKVSRRAAVAWRRRNIFRDIRNKEIVDRGRNWALPA
jgi:hypothetical protein